MIAKLSWTPRAKRDLAEIFEWISGDRPGAAERVYRAITTAASLLRGNPLLGKPRPELNPEIRVLTGSPYLIFYKVVADGTGAVRGVEILRVLHGNRFLPGLFRP